MYTDARVQRICGVLHSRGYQVVLVGRKLKKSPDLPAWPYKINRMRLLFTKGPLFYLFFNIRLFFYLLFTGKVNLYYSNDLDTLLPNYLVSKLKRKPLIYDSHELFCEVPELINSPIKKRIWKTIEKKLVPKVKYRITVSDSIAKHFKHEYNVDFFVIRNVPETVSDMPVKTKSELKLPENKKIIILQGAGINVQRGAEELMEAMKFVDAAILCIIGSGDVWDLLEQRSRLPDLEGKVLMIKRLPKKELFHYTKQADLGISIDKPTNLNYVYSLPNKLFDYIEAEVPVLASRLTEIEKIISRYQIGDFIDNYEPKHIAEKINEMLQSNKQILWKKNLQAAKKALNWETEKQILERLLDSIG